MSDSLLPPTGDGLDLEGTLTSIEFTADLEDTEAWLARALGIEGLDANEAEIARYICTLRVEVGRLRSALLARQRDGKAEMHGAFSYVREVSAAHHALDVAGIQPSSRIAFAECEPLAERIRKLAASRPSTPVAAPDAALWRCSRCGYETNDGSTIRNVVDGVNYLTCPRCLAVGEFVDADGVYPPAAPEGSTES